MQTCLYCGKETTKKYCSNSCSCKDYYLKNKDKQLAKKKAYYYYLKENDYEKLRSINKKASQSYKKKNIEEVRKYNVDYQKRTKQSLKYRNEKKYGGNRDKVLERDSHKCTECLTIKNLIVHHIDGSGHLKNTNNDMTNLVTLCRKCHINTHRGDLINKKI